MRVGKEHPYFWRAEKINRPVHRERNLRKKESEGIRGGPILRRGCVRGCDEIGYFQKRGPAEQDGDGQRHCRGIGGSSWPRVGQIKEGGACRRRTQVRGKSRSEGGKRKGGRGFGVSEKRGPQTFWREREGGGREVQKRRPV